MIGYNGKVGETLFVESNIIKVPVIDILGIGRIHLGYKIRTLVTPVYKKVKLSMVSISLCFRYKLNLSLIVLLRASQLNKIFSLN